MNTSPFATRVSLPLLTLSHNINTDTTATQCCVTFGEAKYLYKSIDAVEANSTFKSRSGRLTPGTQLALSTEAGLAVSPVCGVLAEQAGQDEDDDTICVMVEDKETGLQMPTFVPLSGAKFITHSMGFKLTENAEEGVEALFKVRTGGGSRSERRTSTFLTP